MPGIEGFAELEQNIFKLTAKFRKLSEEHKILEQRFEKMKEKYDKAAKTVEELREEKKQIELKSALGGNEDHSRLMKRHIGRLIKEVDVCIAELKNQGI